MNKEETLKELKQEVSKLNTLLKEDQQGMFTWWEVLSASLKQVKKHSLTLGLVDYIK